MIQAREYTDFAEWLSREAGAVLLKGFRSSETEISYKSSTNIVTSIDKESEALLYSRLKAQYPGHSIIAEEGSRSENNSDYIWYIDPLDGTNNFAHGIPMFCVSLGLYSRIEKKVIAGVVYDAFHDEMFAASDGGGAYLNGRKIRVSATRDIAYAMIATGFPYDKLTSPDNNLREFNNFLPRIQGIRRLGSAALDLCYVACGRLDGFWEPKLYPWDTAAGSVIVREAGGNVSKYDGSPFDPEYPEIMASNGALHPQMIEILYTK